MTKVPRAECIEISYNQALSTLCHQAKNLYNRANFLFKASLNQQNKILNYLDLYKLLKLEVCYKVLPAQTAQQTLKMVSGNWKSYFLAKKEWIQNPNKFNSKPKPPQYKPKDGEGVAILTNQQYR